MIGDIEKSKIILDACESGDVEALKKLLTGFDFYLKHMTFDYPEECGLIIENNKVNIQECLVVACSYRQEAVIKLLLPLIDSKKHDAALLVKTLLDYFVEDKFQALIEYICEHYDVFAPECLIIACKHNNLAAAEYFLTHYNPEKMPEVMKYLVQQDFDIKADIDYIITTKKEKALFDSCYAQTKRRRF